MANYQEYQLVNFDVNREADEIILINNAGTLGEIKPLGQISPPAIELAYQINLVAPSILCKLFIAQTSKRQQKRTIINISSGAAKYPVPSWSTYCASKSGLDLFTKVMAQDHPDVRCHAIAPGIVDTEMQGEIRQLKVDDFPEVGRFKDYKSQGELSDPKKVASKLHRLIENPDLAPGLVFSAARAELTQYSYLG
ncbi:MAG: SDR family NAD(P)-dependent oxidoreductase [Owenweeksia sp.]|nr:SDR family NAD(P)-dependent oxidoreductase [Owenweeksia sp.]